MSMLTPAVRRMECIPLDHLWLAPALVFLFNIRLKFIRNRIMQIFTLKGQYLLLLFKTLFSVLSSVDTL